MIVITGATGKTGSKTAELLLSKGEKVRVLGRFEERLKPLVDKGAEMTAGDQTDANFLTKAFTGADAVYLLIPPKMDVENVRSYYNAMGDAAVGALNKARVSRVIFLSSLGAEKDTGTGPVTGLHDVEKKLDKLTKTDVVFLRAGFFMENLLMGLSSIKNQNVFGNTMVADAPVLMAASKDVAAEAARLLFEKKFKGHSVVDVFGQRISFSQCASIIGAKIAKPGLAYTQFSESDAVAGMTAMGLSRSLAQSFVELSKAVSSGLITTTKGDPEKPNAATKFDQFVEEVLYPAYMHA